MKELLEKLTSYNIFNYLLPGTVFAVASEQFTSYEIIQDDLLLAFFIYYFLGMVISRIGSLIIKPILQWVGFIKEEPYEDYVACEADDKKLEILSEANNSYRTLVAAFFALLALKSVESLFAILSIPEWLQMLSFVIGLFLLFLFSYRKQTSFITKRIQIYKGVP